MKRYLLICLSALCLTSYAQDFSKVKEIINDHINNKNVPSVAIAVVKDGKIIWEEAFGYADKENKRLATVHTPYILASISKTITATAVMKLAEQRKLSINDPINKYLKGAKVSSSRWDANDASIRWVMSHNSGLTSFNAWCRTDSLTCAKNDDVTIGRYAILVRKPGSQFDYSNIGYGLLDRMVRDVSGTTFDRYLKKEIFGPLGMKNSFVACNPLPPDHAVGYHSGGPFLFPPSHDYQAGASSIYSSAHDLALFAMLHLNELKGNKSVLSKTSIEQMRDTSLSGTSEYGLGWWLSEDFNGYRGILAQGGTWVAQAWMRLVPSENMAVVVLTNTGSGDWKKVIEESYAAVLPEFRKKLATFPASNWKGILRTYKGDVPVVFNYDGGTTGTADLGEIKNIPLQEIEAEPNFIAFKFEADLHLEDLGEGPCMLNFYLRREDNELVGSMETRAGSRQDVPTLPFWVELKKAE